MKGTVSMGENGLDRKFMIKVLNNIFMGIFVTDKKGKVLYVNPSIVRQYGNKPEDLVNVIDWGKWEGIVFPILYKHQLKEQRRLFYNQYFRLSDSYNSSVTVPVFLNGDKYDYTVHVIQEDRLKSDQKETKPHFPLFSENHTMQSKLEELMTVAGSDLPILLQGESGTGKTYYARLIHENSPRKDAPFIMLNCGAIPETLIESELFGYAGGAFTGAEKNGKKGFFEMANHGTIFLDEIGDMPLHLQAKLLHVLESQTIRPVGSTESIPIEVRVITATNRAVGKLISEKRFREDLYWRISAYTSVITPLRERKEDIISLSLKFLDSLNQEYHTHKHFYPLTFLYLLSYPWPGNIRELKNAVERAFILTSSNEINEERLPKDILGVFKDRLYKYTHDYDGIVDQAEAVLLNIATTAQNTDSTKKIAEFLNITYPQALYLKEKYLL